MSEESPTADLVELTRHDIDEARTVAERLAEEQA
jgi:hypothetical protein